MPTLKAKLWGKDALDVYVDSRSDADAIEVFVRKVQLNYFAFGALVGAIGALLPVLGLVLLT
jgi:hypothetical protein